MDNYRPISVLQAIAKIIERTVYHQLHKYLQAHHLLSPYQHGFRQRHSTTTATIALTDDIRRNMELGLMTGAIFIDLRKAFDTVDHTILISKLRSFGIANTDLRWFENYLSNHNLESWRLVSLKDLFWGLFFSYYLLMIYLKQLPIVLP